MVPPLRPDALGVMLLGVLLPVGVVLGVMCQRACQSRNQYLGCLYTGKVLCERSGAGLGRQTHLPLALPVTPVTLASILLGIEGKS